MNKRKDHVYFYNDPEVNFKPDEDLVRLWRMAKVCICPSCRTDWTDRLNAYRVYMLFCPLEEALTLLASTKSLIPQFCPPTGWVRRALPAETSLGEEDVAQMNSSGMGIEIHFDSPQYRTMANGGLFTWPAIRSVRRLRLKLVSSRRMFLPK